MLLNNRKLNIAISWIIFLAISFVAINSTIYGHYHITENGHVIWHAHPFQDVTANLPFQKHTHNDYEILNLQLVTNLLVTALLLILLLKLVLKLNKQSISLSQDVFLVSSYNISNQLRAPPIY